MIGERTDDGFRIYGTTAETDLFNSAGYHGGRPFVGTTDGMALWLRDELLRAYPPQSGLAKFDLTAVAVMAAALGQIMRGVPDPSGVARRALEKISPGDFPPPTRRPPPDDWFRRSVGDPEGS